MINGAREDECQCLNTGYLCVCVCESLWHEEWIKWQHDSNNGNNNREKTDKIVRWNRFEVFDKLSFFAPSLYE